MSEQERPQGRATNDEWILLFGGLAYAAACSLPWAGDPQIWQGSVVLDEGARGAFELTPVLLLGHGAVFALLLVQLIGYLRGVPGPGRTMLAGYRWLAPLPVLGIVWTWATLPGGAEFGLILASLALGVQLNGLGRLLRRERLWPMAGAQ
jgi:hypothetical protein